MLAFAWLTCCFFFTFQAAGFKSELSNPIRCFVQVELMADGLTTCERIRSKAFEQAGKKWAGHTSDLSNTFHWQALALIESEKVANIWALRFRVRLIFTGAQLIWLDEILSMEFATVNIYKAGYSQLQIYKITFLWMFEYKLNMKCFFVSVTLSKWSLRSNLYSKLAF